MKYLSKPRIGALIRTLAYFACIVIVHRFTGPRNGVFATKLGMREWPYPVFDALIYLIAIQTSTVVLCRVLKYSSLQSLGLGLTAKTQRDGLFGIAKALGLMSLIFMVSVLLGWVRVTGWGWTNMPTDERLTRLISVCVLQAAIAINEETIFRGFIFQSLRDGLGFGAAALISSLVFALVHITNPQASLLPILALMSPGLLLVMQYDKTRSLWLPIGFHFAWNVAEGPLFGFPISGVDVFTLLETEVVGPDIWVGGKFGPEGALLGIIACCIGYGLLRQWPPDAERRS